MWRPSKSAIQISENDASRSDFVKELIQTEIASPTTKKQQRSHLPKVIVQFWHDKDVPKDVRDCTQTWRKLKAEGYSHVLYDSDSARGFIKTQLGCEYVKAFDRCYHPAMKSDYFRLCYIYSKGGFYVDVDDIYCDKNIDYLFENSQLKLQPLCYDIDSDAMISPKRFIEGGQFTNRWIYYFNNNPIIAPPENPVIEYALTRSTKIILGYDSKNLPEIQSTAGPGNLTASVVAYFSSHKQFEIGQELAVFSDWESFAQTIWDMSYRNDARNWRLSNQKNYFIDTT
jgi:hypothetical protein